MNPTVEHLINEYMQKMRDEYFKTEDKSKEIQKFLNDNFSKYIHLIKHTPDKDSIDVYFNCSGDQFIFPYTIVWQPDKSDKLMYHIEGGKVVYSIDEMIPDICNIIAKLSFKKEIAEYAKTKMDQFPKFPIWKFWKWAW